MNSLVVALLRRAWPWVIATVAISYAAWSFDWSAIQPVLRRMSISFYLAAEVTLVICIFAACAWRWVVVADIRARGMDALRIYMYTSVSIAIGQVTPMQIGEALKIRFAQRNGLPIGRSTVSMIMERSIDLAVVIDLALVGLLQRLDVALLWTGLAALVLPAALFCLPGLLKRLQSRSSSTARTALLGDAERAVAPSRLALVIALTAVKWIFAALSWQVALNCVGCWISLADCILTIATVSVVTMLSMVPGGLGVQELSLMGMLTALGTPPDVAQAGAIAIRMLLPVMVVIGLIQLPGVAWKQPYPIPERG